ncbi:WD40-repeat-containing domain protein [Ganoderma leucocontextum]|nr:WD40-repeat-containing domain protein [Ganoderma leucocontextum]
MAQRTLRSLTLRLHPRARWGSSPCSSSRNPVWLKLDSLTLHVEPDGHLPPNSLPDFVLEICQYATDRISTFHRLSTVKELAIHVSSSASLPSASLALRLINSDYFLDRFRSLHLDLVGQVPLRFQLCIHLPPRTQPRGVIVQGTVLASDNFVFEESYQQQVQYYSEGNIWRTATKSESDSVVALAISPDGKWIASGSRQHAIVWNAMTGGGSDQQYLEMVHEWIAPVDDDPLTRPFAFAPDSLVLACCTRDPEAFIQVRDVITGELLAVLRAPGEAVNGFDACRASCVWSRNSEALTSVVFIPSQHKFVVQVWNAENYRMISTTTEITSFHSPSFLYSPNRHWLASCQTARGHYVQTSPPVSFMRNVGAGTMLGAPLMSVPMDCHILSATFDQSSTRFAAVSSDHVLHVWSLSTGTKLLQVPMNEYPNDSERLVLMFSPDGAQLLSCSGGRGASFVLTTRDASTGRTVLPRRPGYHFLRTRTAPRFVFSDDRRHLLSASEDGVLQLWLAADASFVRDIARGGAAPTTFAWSEDGKILAWGTESGGVVVKPL